MIRRGARTHKFERLLKEEPMRVEWQIAPVSNWQADSVLFYTFEDSPDPLPGFKRWLEESGAWLSHSLALNDFRGKFQDVAVYYGPPEAKISRVIQVGLGSPGQFDMDKLRGATVIGLRKCRELKLTSVAIPLSAFDGLSLQTASALQEVLIAGMLGLYRFDALKTRELEAAVHLERLVILAHEEPDEALRKGCIFASVMVSGITMTRDLVTAPANQVTPEFIVNTARQLAESYGFRLRVIDTKVAQEMGMRAFLSVAQGSREPAYVIVLEHAPAGTEEDAPLVFVGKGITFDTGGISLKPSDKMEMMKRDMAGAAAVLGTFEVLGGAGVRRRVVGILPCTENMPGGKAYKPGDVIRSLSNLTIEVISTDAEGRMILCDALTHALSFKPAVIVDLATLTGACIVALGNQVAGVMGNREELVRKIREIGDQVGERVWPLPLWDLYFENIKSDIADFKNVGDRGAGTIIGGMFLKQFVPDTVPWAHLDVAGTAWTDKDLLMAPKGATGFGVRILTELARRWHELGIESTPLNFAPGVDKNMS
jgi:leucyl aminopeptidase